METMRTRRWKAIRKAAVVPPAERDGIQRRAGVPPRVRMGRSGEEQDHGLLLPAQGRVAQREIVVMKQIDIAALSRAERAVLVDALRIVRDAVAEMGKLVNKTETESERKCQVTKQTSF